MCTGRGEGTGGGVKAGASSPTMSSTFPNVSVHMKFSSLVCGAQPCLPSRLLIPLAAKKSKTKKQKKRCMTAQPQTNRNKSGAFVSSGFDHRGHIFPALKTDYCSVLTGLHSLLSVKCGFRGHVLLSANTSLHPPVWRRQLTSGCSTVKVWLITYVVVAAIKGAHDAISVMSSHEVIGEGMEWFSSRGGFHYIKQLLIFPHFSPLIYCHLDPLLKLYYGKKQCA